MAIGPIIPHLWFDDNAVDAARFYARVFPDAAVDHVGVMHDTPGGDCDFVEFHIAEQPFMALSGGSSSKLNPSVSFILNFDPSRLDDAKGELDRLWAHLVEDGTVRMDLGEYPFSPHYGWVEDRFGVNWQLMLTDPEGVPRPFVIPALMFTDNAGEAEAAIDATVGLFPESHRGLTRPYPAGMEPQEEGWLMFADFQLGGQWFAAMDSGGLHDFAFNEAISLLVECDTQEEMDGLTDALSAVPEAEQCGWLKDRFGISWQITPRRLQELMRGDQATVDRVMQAILPMRRLNVAAIEAAAQA